ncbi:MAG TPA: LamG domain-containing protein [bacterium]|uniref:LamG-like jellyroll fold domain-containing protein n=1 Tax=candidate division TA06 bacterium ADurb.Bin417 TaxID=1852828 RepID=A0A1V5MFL5_UNCT6|nr:MAG: hypothetical protein BWY73_00958 [candidate division TA06 bacterium ADurb.Bin417]HNQ34601.1 LamG domain-containing protein [bacterium]HNS49269.1 LamG domain-containing protein [bacterium]
MKRLIPLLALALLALAPAAGAAEPGLVLHYSMEEAVDGVVRDLSGNNNHLKLGPGAALADGQFGKALVLDGKGAILVPDSPSLRSIKNGLTVSLWLRLDTDAIRWTSFVKKDAATEATGKGGGPTAYRPFRGFNLGTNGSSGPTKIKEGAGFLFTVDGVGGRDTVSVPMAKYVEPGRWVHLAATYNTGSRDRGLRLFVNGVLIGDIVMIEMPTDISTETPLTIGRDLTGLVGALDEIRIYDRPLPEAEIKKIFQSAGK